MRSAARLAISAVGRRSRWVLDSSTPSFVQQRRSPAGVSRTALVLLPHHGAALRAASSAPEMTHQRVKGRRRFYKAVTIRQKEGAPPPEGVAASDESPAPSPLWEVLLDDRVLKTPARRPLQVIWLEPRIFNSLPPPCSLFEHRTHAMSRFSLKRDVKGWSIAFPESEPTPPV